MISRFLDTILVHHQGAAAHLSGSVFLHGNHTTRYHSAHDFSIKF